MPNTGFVLAGSGANNADAGAAAWSNPGNVTADDGAVASAGSTPAATTQYLHATNFGFAIPAGAVIDGVQVRVQRSANATTGVIDQTIQLIVGGARSGANKADTVSPWPASFTNKDYGSISDTWALLLTASDVNSSNFGIALRAENLISSRIFNVDAIWIAVEYTEPVGEVTGSVATAATSNATKQSVGAISGATDVAAVGAPTFEATAAATGTSVADVLAGHPGSISATSDVAASSEATKHSVAAVSGTVSIDAVSNANKESAGQSAATSVVASVSNADKASVGTVSASQTVAAVSATSQATKQSVAVVSQNLAIVTGVGTYKTGIRRAAALNDVPSLPNATLVKSPAPVPLSVQ